MKITCLFLLGIMWAALAPGTGYAVPSSPTSHETTPTSSAKVASDHPRDSGHPVRVHNGLAKANHPTPVPNYRRHSGTAANVQPPVRYNPRGVGEGERMPNEAIPNASSGRISAAVRPSTPSLNVVHHRGPNPAVVSGSPNLRSSNTGVIKGSGISRRR